jgi:hypothetical protein
VPPLRLGGAPARAPGRNPNPAPAPAPAEPGTPGRATEGASPMRALAFRLDTRSSSGPGSAGSGGGAASMGAGSVTSGDSCIDEAASAAPAPPARGGRGAAGAAWGTRGGRVERAGGGMGGATRNAGPGNAGWQPAGAAGGAAGVTSRMDATFDSLYEEANSLLKNLHFMRIKRRVSGPLASPPGSPG